jgi:hypothetical protein
VAFSSRKSHPERCQNGYANSENALEAQLFGHLEDARRPEPKPSPAVDTGWLRPDSGVTFSSAFVSPSEDG